MTDTSTPSRQGIIDAWIDALHARHTAELSMTEIARALRALSASYVERRDGLLAGRPLESRGKRAAFALYYGPLHFVIVSHILHSLGGTLPAGSLIADLGCGTGVCGAAWALQGGRHLRVLGVDRHPTIVHEARWTYQQLRVDGVARVGHVTTQRVPRARAYVAAYLLNELTTDDRLRLWSALRQAASEGAAVLIVEPIARRMAPWWDQLAEEARALGGRSDEWRFAAALPGVVAQLDKAAGLDHRTVTARSIFVTAQ